MADVKITLFDLGSNSRFGEGWDTIKASDSKPFSDYAKQAVKFIIKVALIPFKSLLRGGKVVLGHRVAKGKWRRSEASYDSVWSKVKDATNQVWRKEK